MLHELKKAQKEHTITKDHLLAFKCCSLRPDIYSETKVRVEYDLMRYAFLQQVEKRDGFVKRRPNGILEEKTLVATDADKPKYSRLMELVQEDLLYDIYNRRATYERNVVAGNAVGDAFDFSK